MIGIRRRARAPRRLAWAAATVAVLLVAGYLQLRESAREDPSAVAVSARDDATIVEAFRDRRSGLMVESAGTVQRVLADDREGSQHQRFIVGLDNGHTLLISHNIDLAERLPVETGDPVEFRGQYEWNERGGVIHWTHHDPQGRREGGWLKHDGRVYR